MTRVRGRCGKNGQVDKFLFLATEKGDLLISLKAVIEFLRGGFLSSLSGGPELDSHRDLTCINTHTRGGRLSMRHKHLQRKQEEEEQEEEENKTSV